MAKKKKEIRDMSRDQLIDHVEVLKKELFNLWIIMFFNLYSVSNKSKRATERKFKCFNYSTIPGSF